MPKKKCPKMEEQGCLFIVCPTLEMRLRASSNLKRVAMNANMEYSNFIKACKLESNLNLRTYLKCAKAFDKEVVLLHLPSGFVESITTPQKHQWFSTIEQRDLMEIVRKLFQIDTEVILFHIEHFVHQMKEQGDDESMKQLLASLFEVVQKLLRNYGHK